MPVSLRAVLFALALVLAGLPVHSAVPSKGSEILWDKYGVPHVYAKNVEDLFYGYGWAQAHSHGNLLLRLYGESRGRGAEYFGREALALDRWLAVNAAPETAERWYQQQTPQFRRYLDAFAKGINDYAAKHPDALSAEVKAVLPVTGKDPLQHALRLFQYSYVASAARVTSALRPVRPGVEDGGSNAWAIAPSRTASGKAMLLGNPHLPWQGWYTYYEAHLTAPGINLYGATQVGLPVLRFVFSDYLGFNQTVNGIDGMDLYELTEKENSYEQTARNFAEYRKAVSRLQVPTFNIVYADRDGHIHYLFNGLAPKRKSGDLRTWAGIVPGNTSETLWTEYHSFEELPQVLDPPTGYVQNTNDPPWNAAWPASLDPAKYPSYLAPRNTSFRAESSLRMLSEMQKLTLDDFVAKKHSTRAELADRVMEDLLAAVEAHGSTARVKRAAAVLKAWDRQTNADSHGALLFLYWAQNFMGPAMANQSGFAVPYTIAEPLTTPRGFKDPAKAVAFLEQAAEKMESDFGALDVAWGDVMKYRVGNLELPANGGFGNLGIFRVITFGPMQEKKRTPIHGETFVLCVEFGKTPRAQAVMSYGNSSQPGSPHAEDQLPFLTRKQLRPVLRDRKSVMAQLEHRERF